MIRRDLLTLTFASLLLLTGLAYFQGSPGYMDADYYYITGRELALGHGFNEPVIWNYLSDPVGLPHPSHAYWMPLASLLASAGMWLAQNPGFPAARIGFILIAGLIPPVTAILCEQITGRHDHARLAGLLALLPGLYLSYLGTTDTFGLTMLLGGIFFLLVARTVNSSKGSEKDRWMPLVLGLVAGCMHLGRTEGVIWLVIALGLPWVGLFKRRSQGAFQWQVAVASSGLFLVGYALIITPWILRNLAVFAVPLSPGGGRALWQTSYDELFIYPPQTLTFQHWLSAGWQKLVIDRLEALNQNLQTSLVVQGEIFLAPLALVGFWKHRADRRIQAGVAVWGAVLALMTLVFPYAGWRGGFFHSGAGLQPLIWALAPVGLEAFIAWGGRVRHWNRSQAAVFFRIGLVLLSLLLSGVGFGRRVIGADIRQPAWDQAALAYTRLGSALITLDAGASAPVLVNNPPGFYAANDQPAIVIPDGDPDITHQVALRYGARYLLLEENHPADLDPLYQQPASRTGWRYVATFEETRIYEAISAR